MIPLNPDIVQKVIGSLPSDITSVLQQFGPKAMLAGGYIRAIVAGEKPSDIDLFVPSKEMAKDLGAEFYPVFHTSPNAITIRRPGYIPVQIIHRWVFPTAEDCVKSFDFTISQAVIWWDGEWKSLARDRFLVDVLNRELHYTVPVREEECAGSLFRLFKFYRRGYSVSLETLADVLARTVKNSVGSVHTEGELSLVLEAALERAGRFLPKPPPYTPPTPEEESEERDAGAVLTAGWGASS